MPKPDAAAAARVRAALAGTRGVGERSLFGALLFSVRGHLAVGVRGDELIVRAAPADEATLAAEPGARAFDHKGRRMAGWILVKPAGYASEAALRRWVRRAVAHAGSLPPEDPARRRSGPAKARMRPGPEPPTGPGAGGGAMAAKAAKLAKGPSKAGRPRPRR